MKKINEWLKNNKEGATIVFHCIGCMYPSISNRLEALPFNLKGKIAYYFVEASNKCEERYALNFIFLISKFLNYAKVPFNETLIDIAYYLKDKERAFTIVDEIILILLSKEVEKNNLQSTILTSLINSSLFSKMENNQNLDFLVKLIKALDKNIIEAEYLLNCPTIKHCELIHAICNSPSIIESGFVLEFCDEALNIDENQIEELIFKIQNGLVKKTMTFEELSLKYNKVAMDILRNSKGKIVPETIVTFNISESEIQGTKKL